MNVRVLKRATRLGVYVKRWLRWVAAGLRDRESSVGALREVISSNV